ncbi:O-antigen ligase-like membrane protein [Motilibacter peucedani]|uniref:O-antigen ligase-like membrane protein n=1 Tax=Motilibacter peucedani TaxID=598650 RepID=A0A420XTW0_9ACTN|nr:O-antigen ligase family protein [Motilibacter peucedani]RKS80302.1 O-antigen ligase-like membrane protein [Motilibacter peucedani]
MTTLRTIIRPPRTAARGRHARGDAPGSPLLASLALLAALCWLLATGRWGAYVGLPHDRLFATDIALGASALALLPHLRTQARGLRRLARDPLAVVMLALFAWCTVRFLSPLHWTHDGLRDYVPYGYALVALLAVLTRSWRRLRAWHVGVVLVAHLVWVYYSARILARWDTPVLGPIRMFTLRTDFEAMVFGLGGIFSLLQLLRPSHWAARAGWLALGLASFYELLQQNNRASVVATAVGIVGVGLPLAVRLLSTPRLSRWHKAALAALTLVVVVVGGILSAHSPTVVKIQNTLNGKEEGTVQARQEVYRRVVHHATSSPSHVLVGDGFGPDFLEEIGAARYYEASYDRVRAPHDIVLNTLARTGFPGAVLHAGVILLAMVSAVRALWRPNRSPGLQLAAVSVLVVPVVALFGVILESPFGAVPYFWAVGTLLAALSFGDEAEVDQ